MLCRNTSRAPDVLPVRVSCLDEDALSYLNDPEHWRDRARQTRATAETVTDSAAKRAMLTIADEYLANRAEDPACNVVAVWLRCQRLRSFSAKRPSILM